MKKIIIIIACLVCVNAIAAEPIEIVDNDWTYLQHISTGFAWELGSMESHSIAFLSAVTWRDMINFDVGLIDIEKVEADGDRWYNDLKPIVGISVDVLKLLDEVPQLEPIIGWVPNAVGLGAGIHFELESDHDAIPTIYLVIKW